MGLGTTASAMEKLPKAAVAEPSATTMTNEEVDSGENQIEDDPMPLTVYEITVLSGRKSNYPFEKILVDLLPRKTLVEDPTFLDDYSSLKRKDLLIKKLEKTRQWRNWIYAIDDVKQEVFDWLLI